MAVPFLAADFFANLLPALFAADFLALLLEAAFLACFREAGFFVTILAICIPSAGRSLSARGIGESR
ncbi:MAG: hypothetical protein J2P49_10305, partial [Methylocapsa sp.]|nr:hypothetical protein [Methylocapsa sp.]